MRIAYSSTIKSLVFYQQTHKKRRWTKEKHLLSQRLLGIGMTGFEPATTPTPKLWSVLQESSYSTTILQYQKLTNKALSFKFIKIDSI